MRGAALTLILTGVGIAVAIPLVASYLLHGESVLGLFGLSLVVGGAMCLVLGERGRPAWSLAVFAATAVVFVTSIFGFAVLMVDRHQSSPPLIAQIESDSVEPPEIASYGFFRPSFVYYAGRPVTYCQNTQTLHRFAEQAARPYVITTSEQEDEVRQTWPGPLSVLVRTPCFMKRKELMVLMPSPSDPVARTAQR